MFTAGWDEQRAVQQPPLACIWSPDLGDLPKSPVRKRVASGMSKLCRWCQCCRRSPGRTLVVLDRPVSFMRTKSREVLGATDIRTWSLTCKERGTWQGEDVCVIPQDEVLKSALMLGPS